MSNINIYKILETQRDVWAHDARSQLAIEACINVLREAEARGYFGTLYRTDFEVEGAGAFPVDMLRYTSSWPKDEVDSQAIEDSLDDNVRSGSPRREPRKITLSMKHRDPEPNLAADRWAAKFRWRVVRVVETVAR